MITFELVVKLWGLGLGVASCIEIQSLGAGQGENHPKIIRQQYLVV